MANYREVFTNKHVVLPVIHVETTKQTMQNAAIAQEAGADGAFLISMQGMDHRDLLKMHETVRKEFATWWIGVNCLDLHAISVFDQLNPGVSGVWSDNACIYEWQEKQLIADQIQKARIQSGWKGLYFGGVAFKYQRQVDNIALAAKIATKYMDVVTTSGEGTGHAPDREKIALMKASIGQFPLGIASGISPENVRDYLEVADCFLVATSLLVPGKEQFDPYRVRALIEAVRG
ncbi:MAG: BtpA/SgcQ family protein [bacterium]|nr:BtpA/SgcQ family protein [bacterium]